MKPRGHAKLVQRNLERKLLRPSSCVLLTAEERRKRRRMTLVMNGALTKGATTNTIDSNGPVTPLQNSTKGVLQSPPDTPRSGPRTGSVFQIHSTYGSFDAVYLMSSMF
jgi:hypothetical protein